MNDNELVDHVERRLSGLTGQDMTGRRVTWQSHARRSNPHGVISSETYTRDSHACADVLFDGESSAVSVPIFELSFDDNW